MGFSYFRLIRNTKCNGIFKFKQILKSDMNSQTFYQKFPYPLFPKPIDWAKPLLHEIQNPKRILHAGCATGSQTKSLAYTFPEAEIIGIDFSNTSVDLAKQLLTDPKLKNTKFFVHDLTEPIVEKYGQFDFIVSYGVLHHIERVNNAMQNLRAALKDEQSPFLIFVYGAYGRATIARIQQACKLIIDSSSLTEEELRALLYSTSTKIGTFDGLRGFVKKIIINLSQKMRLGWESSMADALINPYVMYYTLDSIQDLLARNNFRFGNFIHRAQSKAVGFPQHIDEFLLKNKIPMNENVSNNIKMKVCDLLSAPKEYEFICYRSN